MSRCNANPCCGDPAFCEIPLPQHSTGLPHLNHQSPPPDTADERPALSSLKGAAELRKDRRDTAVALDSGTGGQQPVAWRWRHPETDGSDAHWHYVGGSEKPESLGFSQDYAERIEFEAVYVARNGGKA